MRSFQKVVFSACLVLPLVYRWLNISRKPFLYSSVEIAPNCAIAVAETWVPARLPEQRLFPMVLCQCPRSPWPVDCCFAPWSMGRSSSWWTWFRMLQLPSIYGWKAPPSFQTSVDSSKEMFLVPLACRMPPNADWMLMMTFSHGKRCPDTLRSLMMRPTWQLCQPVLGFHRHTLMAPVLFCKWWRKPAMTHRFRFQIRWSQFMHGGIVFVRQISLSKRRSAILSWSTVPKLTRMYASTWILSKAALATHPEWRQMMRRSPPARILPGFCRSISGIQLVSKGVLQPRLQMSQL